MSNNKMRLGALLAVLLSAGTLIFVARAGTLEFDGVPVDITTSTNEDLTIVPGEGGNTQIGDASGSNTHATSNDDLHVTGALEVDGIAYADSGIMSGGGIAPGTDSAYSLGTSSAAWSSIYVDSIRGVNAALAFNPAAGYGLTGSVTLNAATGNEVAYDLAATVNKATSGNYTGLKLNVTETSAPGSSDKLADLQIGGISWAQVFNNAGSANYGLLSLGPAAWDGATAGFFGTGGSSSANGTVFAINAANGYAGDLVNLEIYGSSKFKIDSSGNVTAAGTIAGSGNLGGSGTAGRVPRWSTATTLTDSGIADSSDTVALTIDANEDIALTAGGDLTTTGTVTGGHIASTEDADIANNLTAGDIIIDETAGVLAFSGATSAAVSTSTAGVGLTLDAADSGAGTGMNYISVTGTPPALDEAADTIRMAYVNLTNSADHTDGSVYGLDVVTSASDAQATEYGVRVGTTWDAQIALLESVGDTYYTTFKAGNQGATINYTLPTAAATVNNQALTSTTAGVMGWSTISSVAAAGSDTQVQFNDGGTALGGDANFTYNKTTDALTVSGLTLAAGSITDTTGTISFDNENLTTTGNGTFSQLILSSDPAVISSANEIALEASGDTDDYIVIQTSSNIPEITAEGVCDMKITGYSGGTTSNDGQDVIMTGGAGGSGGAIGEGGDVIIRAGAPGFMGAVWGYVKITTGSDTASHFPASGDPESLFIDGLLEVNNAAYFDKVNAADGDADAITLSGTLGAFNGTDTFRGLFLDYTNANHTGSSNIFYGVDVDSITGDAEATEAAINVGTGWDSVLSLNGTTIVDGSGNFSVGTGAAGTDYTLTFDGETNDGVLTWMEDEDYFSSSDKVVFQFAADASSGTTNNSVEIAVTTPLDDTLLSTHNLLNIDTEIGNAVTPTNVNLIAIDALTGDDYVTLKALNIGNLTGTGATERAIDIGSGWDAQIALLESTGATYYTTFKAGDQAATVNYTLPTAAPTVNNQALTSTTAGVTSWSTISSVAAAGSDTYVQFNDGGTALGGDANFTYNKTTDALTVSGLTLATGSITDTTDAINFGNDSLTTTGTLGSGNLTIGSGAAGVDYALTFNGETNDGILTWMEDEDYFQLSDDALMATTENLYFRDTALKIYSSADGQLDIDADTELEITAPTVDIDASAEVNVSNNLTVGGELKGSRMMLIFNRTTISADAYTGSAAQAFTSTTGYAMPRAGSIVGISVNGNVSAETTAGDFIAQARVNDTSVLTQTITTSGTGAYTGYSTQARATDTFSAGALITGYIDFDTFVGTINPVSVVIEVQFDT